VDNLIFAVRLSRPGSARAIDSMPGNFRLSVDQLVEECREVRDLGILA
jgi:delta-aminolevulinic acid dehydratase/porphobilinogen synthase